jgi:hypothetical protein
MLVVRRKTFLGQTELLIEIIELLAKEARGQSTPATNLQSQTENPRAFTVAPNNP